MDSQGDKILSHSVGAALTEAQVVFASSALVAMALDHHRSDGILIEPMRLLAERFPVLAVQVVRVEIKMHRVADDHIEVLNRIWRRSVRRGRVGRLSRCVR